MFLAVRLFFRDRRVVTATIALLVATVSATTFVVLHFTTAAPPRAGTLPTASAVPTPNGAPADTHQRIIDILTQMHDKAFNPTASPPKNSAGVQGGLYVNWSATWDGNPSTAADNTNFTSNGRTDVELGVQPRHDEFTDLIYLRDLLGYRAAYPSDHRFDPDIARMEPIVRSDFAHYTYYKCFLYGELEDMARFEPDGGWGAMADAYVRAVYAHYFTGDLGTVVAGADGTYRVDFAAECAVAFIQSGNRLHDTGMVSAGDAIVQHLLNNAIDPTTHLLPLQLQAAAGSRDTLVQQQVKMGEEAQSLDALLTLYQLTGNAALLTNVQGAVTWLFSGPLHDTQDGGFYFAVDTNGSSLDSRFKESRQAWVLTLLQHLDTLEPGKWSAQSAEILDVVRQKLWGAVSDGYVYRVTPAYQVYQSKAGLGRTIVTENWVTTEAMDIACQALEGPAG